uniref:NR LBD domain-containing protein n=1 Tax=Acrobeloides nanus TaxID=290746 RepID=A0A914DVV2_9BILA
MYHAIKEVVEPMRRMKIMKGEIALLKVISALTPVPGLSKKSHENLLVARNRYVEVLAEMVRETVTIPGIMASLNRMTCLMTLLTESDKVAQMADSMMGYMSAFSLGEIRGTLPYEIHISKYKMFKNN